MINSRKDNVRYIGSVSIIGLIKSVIRISVKSYIGATLLPSKFYITNSSNYQLPIKFFILPVVSATTQLLSFTSSHTPAIIYSPSSTLPPVPAQLQQQMSMLVLPCCYIRSHFLMCWRSLHHPPDSQGSKHDT